jgi:hypothetical protein
MTITASGLYGLTVVKHLNFTSVPAGGLDSETAIKVLMTTDTYAPDFNVHDFRDDVTNEVTGTGYSAGGVVMTGTTLTVSGGNLTYDGNDVSWATSTIANAMCAVGYIGRGGASSADELEFLSDFVTAASSSGGTFTIQWSASGIWVMDFTP